MSRGKARARIGISACLLGERVRYDGGHKRDPLLADRLARLVEWVPVCPEVEVGMGVPRDTLRLAGDPAAPRLVVERTGTDETARMLRWARARLEALARERLAGFVLKSRSPSCGLGSVSVHRAGGRLGSGLFASALRARFPRLPIVEEGRLHDPAALGKFLARVAAYAKRRPGASGASASREGPPARSPSRAPASPKAAGAPRAPRSGRGRSASRQGSSGGGA